MSNVSPLLENLPFDNYTTDELWEYFYENTKNRITDFSDIQGDEDKIKRSSTWVYLDSNHDHKHDKGETFRFFITFFSSEDDSLLEALYPKVTPLKNEIIILVENNSTDVFSGASYYIKLGENLHEGLLENKNFFSKGEGELITQISHRFGIPTSQFNEEAFSEAIKTIRKKGAGKYTDPSTFELLQAGMTAFSILNPNLSFGFSGLNSLILGLIDDGIDGLNNAKYKPNEWKFAHKDKNINLPFFPNYSALRNNVSDKEIEFAISKISKKIKSNIESLRNNIDGKPDDTWGYSFMTFLDPLAVVNMPLQLGGNFLLSLASPHIFDEILDSIESFVSEATKFLYEMIDNGFIFMNALLCGFVNSLLSTIEGLLFIIKLPFWLMEKTLTMFSSNPEKMDETVQTIVRFDFAKAKNQFWNFLGRLIEKISKFSFSDFLDSIGVAEVGYFVGCIIEFIVEIIIGAITFGTYSAASITAKIGKVFKSIIDTIFSIVRKFFKVAKGVTVDSAKFLLKIFAKGADEFGKLLDEMWEALSKWIDDLLGFTRKFDDIYKLLYKRPKGLHTKLTRTQVYKKFGSHARKLFDVVEKQYKKEITTLKTGNARMKKVLVSGMVDEKTGKVSKVFSNFTFEEIVDLEHIKFLKKLHPTLKKRLEEHIKRAGKDGKGLNLEDPDVYKYAWSKSKDGVPYAHAEFRALDDILKKIDPKGSLGEKAIKRISGYNSFLKKPGIQHTCADCFYLTNGVTFII